MIKMILHSKFNQKSTRNNKRVLCLKISYFISLSIELYFRYPLNVLMPIDCVADKIEKFMNLNDASMLDDFIAALHPFF